MANISPGISWQNVAQNGFCATVHYPKQDGRGSHALCAHVGGMSTEILVSIRQKFLAKREEIVSCSKPWTPWALTALLQIDDSKTTLPAELLLYKALCQRNRTGIEIQDEIIQV